MRLRKQSKKSTSWIVFSENEARLLNLIIERSSWGGRVLQLCLAENIGDYFFRILFREIVLPTILHVFS